MKPLVCKGSCDQGRRACPHPEVCAADEPPPPDLVRVVLTDIALSAVLIAVVAGVVLWVAR